jgi:glucose/mannose transport system permease protein
MIAWNVWISCTDWKGTAPENTNFVGLSNYSRAFGDSLFRQSLVNTLLLFLAIPCSVGLGLFLAMLLRQKVRGARVFTIIYLMPFAFSLVVTGVVWNWVYRLVGSPHIQSTTVMLSIILAMMWQFAGYAMLILLPGLRSIPQKEIDDAKSKGVSTFRIYRKIVFPRLKIPILTAAVLLMTFALKASFDLVWTLTSGGPGTSSYTVPIDLYREAFQKFNFAYGAAMGNILLAIVLCIVLPYVWWSYRKSEKKIVAKREAPPRRPLRVMRKIGGAFKQVGRPLLALVKAFQKIGKTLHKKMPPWPFKRIALYLILILFVVFFFLPIWAAITTSFKTEEEILKSNPLLPSSPTLDGYREALGYLGRPIINSLMFTTGAVLGSLFLGSMLGYLLSKIRFKYDTWVFMIMAVGIFLPFTTIGVPLYQTISKLGLVGTIPGLILVHTVYGIPVCTFIFRNFYAEIPQNVVDRAKKKGASDWEIYRKIVLPASGPAIITVVIFQFTSIWNDFFFGLILGNTPGAMPATVALSGLSTGTIEWSVLMAGAVIVFLPVLLLYIFLGKYIVRYYMGGEKS